jgi:hypothetical protein
MTLHKRKTLVSLAFREIFTVEQNVSNKSDTS